MEKKNKALNETIAVKSERIPVELSSKILDTLDSLVFVTDMVSNKIIFANSACGQEVGFDPTGHDFRDFLSCLYETDSDFCENSLLVTEDGRPRGLLFREFQNPFNNKWFATKTRALEWSQGRMVRLDVALDITDSRRLQSHLTEARQQAENAMITKNRFVTLVAHDLKSPFVSILGMLKRILKKESFRYEVHRRFLESIIANGQRMLKMIDTLLDMDRLETGKIKPEADYFNLYQMVEEVFENFAHLAEVKDLQMINMVPSETEIFADKYLYFIVLNNLISNAVKFSFTSGWIRVSYETDAHGDRVVVEDEGKGVPEAYIDDLFRPDVKTTTQGTGGEAGSGLGLVFCQEIMKAHGGSITVKSIEGEGTTFYVALSPSCRLSSSKSS